jgi:DNA-binding NarL/FixJ family response regulator
VSAPIVTSDGPVVHEAKLTVAVVVTDEALRARLLTIFAEAGFDVADVADADVVVSARGALIMTNTARTSFEELHERAAHALLTPRELEVLAAIGAGLANKAIARQLGISLHTVKFHIESLFRKLGARSRAEAVAKGLERRVRETVEL